MIAHHNHSCQKERKNSTYFAVQHQKGRSYIGLLAQNRIWSLSALQLACATYDETKPLVQILNRPDKLNCMSGHLAINFPEFYNWLIIGDYEE